MGLLSKLKTDVLEARKAAVGKSTTSEDWIRSQLLVVLTSEASKIGKDQGNRDSTDEEVRAVMRKFLKGMDETLRLNVSSDVRRRVLYEKSVVESYLPQPLAESEIRAEIELIASARGSSLGVKDTGLVMKTLNEKYPGRVNGAVVSQILKIEG